jgi:hypothetical protein
MLSEEGGHYRPPVSKYASMLRAVTGLYFFTARCGRAGLSGRPAERCTGRRPCRHASSMKAWPAEPVPSPRRHHSGFTRRALRRAVLRRTERDGRVQAREAAALTSADLLVLVPWLIFGVGLAVICYRLLRRRAARRRGRGSRLALRGLATAMGASAHP